MNFGRILTAPCINELPPPDARCDDAAFRLNNPEVCPTQPQLILKPGVALMCNLASVQFKAYLFRDGAEQDVTSECVFQTSNANVVVVGAISGNATGMGAGSATISASYGEFVAYADIDVLAGDNCCDDINVAIMVLVDQTKSMGQSFSGSYSTKLAFAKAAALQFISEVNEQKDTVGLMRYTGASSTVLSSPTSDKSTVGSLVASIGQTQQSTAFYDAIAAAITELEAVTADRKMIVVVSDGEDQTESYASGSDPIVLANNFKAAGGIVMAVGVRSHGGAYSLLSALATGGFFINAYGGNEDAILGYMSGLKGYVCSGNCVPQGDDYIAFGKLNYSGFANWQVTEGHVDLIGNGFLDLIPDSDLYVDMAGSRSTYKGKLVSKDGYAVENGKTYRFSIEAAGNQRLDATSNTIEAKIFSLAGDGLATPSAAPSASNAGSGSADLETYEYAVSYVNANGETPISPVGYGGNGSFDSFTNTVTHAGESGATMARLWKKFNGLWYLIAESADVGSPSFEDTYNFAALEAAIDAGTVDDAIRPMEVNLTGTPNVRVSQTIAINDFKQGFQTYSLSFTANQDETVYLSVQQIASPTGYDAIGLLLGSAKFENVTDSDVLLTDTFENENQTYIPPACGAGSTYVYLPTIGGYGYLTGTSCYGEGCLDVPPPSQAQDPDPLSDIEAGYIPPRSYTSEKTVCKSCNSGFVNAESENLELTFVESHLGPPRVSIYQLTDGAAVLHRFCLGPAPTLGIFYTDVRFYGSNNGSTWTLLAEVGDVVMYNVNEKKCFLLDGNTTAYSYYKISAQTISPNTFVTDDFTILASDSMFGERVQSTCATETAESEISQSDADQKATLAATTAANVALNCIPVYTATESFTATCPSSSFGVSVTRSATRSSLNSLEEAQAMAHQAAQDEAEAALDCSGSNNTQQLNIPDGPNPPTKASPYPSVKFVEDVVGTITKVTVELKRFNHGNYADVAILLVSPEGTGVYLMGNCMDAAFDTIERNFVLDDAAGSSIPAASRPAGVDHTYKPTIYGGQINPFPSPAPAPNPGPNYETTLAAFIGENPNGAWALYVLDDTTLDWGYFQNGWDLTITT